MAEYLGKMIDLDALEAERFRTEEQVLFFRGKMRHADILELWRPSTRSVKLMRKRSKDRQQRRKPKQQPQQFADWMIELAERVVNG